MPVSRYVRMYACACVCVCLCVCVCVYTHTCSCPMTPRRSHVAAARRLLQRTRPAARPPASPHRARCVHHPARSAHAAAPPAHSWNSTPRPISVHLSSSCSWSAADTRTGESPGRCALECCGGPAHRAAGARRELVRGRGSVAAGAGGWCRGDARAGNGRTIQVVALVVANAVRHVDICARGVRARIRRAGAGGRHARSHQTMHQTRPARG